MAKVPANCPHCGQKLSRLELPVGLTWEEPFHLVCFNDECPYYVKGWEIMSARYGRRVSYRYRVNPETGESGPIPVWSASALRNKIIDPGEDG